MKAGFLSLYNDELDQLRIKAQRFAERHPKVAGRLRMSPNTVDDPHVERLLQGVAFAAARIRQRIDDSFPELTDTLLETLYPHYLAPLPSTAIMQFAPARDQDDRREIPRGTQIESEPVEGEICRFRTTQDVELWPVEITAAELTGTPLKAPPQPQWPAQSVLRLSLKTTKQGLSFHDLGMDRLRVFLRASWTQALALNELIHNQLLGIAFGDHPEDRRAIFREASDIRPVGFSDAQALIPRSSRSFKGYLLMSEFFGFAEKFLFFDIHGLSAKTLVEARGDGERLDIFFYLKTWLPELAPHINAQSFALGCSPTINLFERKAEPIRFDSTRTDYAIVPDARRFQHQEVYSVDRVMLTGRDAKPFEAPAFFGGHQKIGPATESNIFWQFRRVAREDEHRSDHACLSIFDAELKPSAVPNHVAVLDVTCFNRDLPAKLTFGAGRPLMQCAASQAGEIAVQCITPPQKALRPVTREAGHWRLLSHLSLNHLSLSGGDGAGPQQTAESLRSILRLYDLRQVPETRKMIDAIQSVWSEPATARLGDGAIARGLQVNITFSHRQIDAPTGFFFAGMLERFFGLYCSINSFTMLTALMDDRQEPIFTGRPVAGERWVA